MSQVMVVTDSTANIPNALLQDAPIQIVPLQLIWGEKLMQDGVDIQPAEFYQQLRTAEILPTTSQATPEEFKQVYKRLIEQGFDILSIHISSKLSGTLDSAIQAKRAFPGSRIELIDSMSASMAMGFQVLAAARVAAMGGSLHDCKAVAEKAKNQTGVYFAVNTLEFLQRGGRIGGATALLGTMLNLKPLLELRDGQIESVDKVRTFSKTLERLLDLVSARLENEPGPVRLCAIHGDALKEANQLLDAAITEISPVIGTHAGPGALGLAFMIGM
jgi:DegV family protein with EDD domain